MLVEPLPELEGHLSLSDLGPLPVMPELHHTAGVDSALAEPNEAALLESASSVAATSETEAPMPELSEESFLTEEQGLNLLEIRAGTADLAAKFPALPESLKHLEHESPLELEAAVAAAEPAAHEESPVLAELSSVTAPLAKLPPAPAAAAEPLDADAQEIAEADKLLAETQALNFLQLYEDLGFEASADSDSETESETETETESEADTDADADADADWYGNFAEVASEARYVDKFDAQDRLTAEAEAKARRLKLSGGIPVYPARVLDPFKRPEIVQMRKAFAKIQHTWSRLPPSWNPKIAEQTEEERWNKKYPLSKFLPPKPKKKKVKKHKRKAKKHKKKKALKKKHNCKK